MSIEAIGAPAPAVAMDVELPADSSSKPVALHSPPDSNNAVDADGSDSELSDLDELADKLGGALGDELKSAPENAPMSEPTHEPKDESKIEPEPEPQPPVEDIGEILPDHWSGTVPVFKPTMKQFQDFKLFVRRRASDPHPIPRSR
jgi:hypothetical protein